MKLRFSNSIFNCSDKYDEKLSKLEYVYEHLILDILTILNQLLIYQMRK